MAFSDAFARGYAVGTDMKKRRATSKFFEEFKKLTKEDDEEMVAPDGAAIPAPKEEASMAEAEPVATEALPVDKKAAVQVDSTALSPTEEPPAAIPTTPPAATPEAAPAAEEKPAALPLAPEAPKAEGEAPELAAALPAEAPAEAKGAAKEAQKVVSKASLTQADIKKLDRLALKAAEAAGDIEIYTTLQQTTDRFLQGKVQKYLSMAQTAATNEDMDAVEKMLTKAYRYVPDGQEVKFKRKDGKLWVNNPWYESGSEDPKEIPLGAEQISWISVQLADPQKWGDIMREERARLRDQKLRERGVKVEEGNLAVRQETLAETIRSNKEGEKETKRANQAREGNEAERLSQSRELLPYQKYGLLAGAIDDLTGSGGKGGASGMKPDDMRQLSEAAANRVQGFLRPEGAKDATGMPTQGQTPQGYEMFVGKDGNLNGLGFRAQEVAGVLSISNPDLGGPAAAQAGIEVIRALAMPPGPNSPDVGVFPESGVIEVTVGGRKQQFKVPPSFIQQLAEAADATQGAK